MHVSSQGEIHESMTCAVVSVRKLSDTFPAEHAQWPQIRLFLPGCLLLSPGVKISLVPPERVHGRNLLAAAALTGWLVRRTWDGSFVYTRETSVSRYREDIYGQSHRPKDASGLASA